MKKNILILLLSVFVFSCGKDTKIRTFEDQLSLKANCSYDIRKNEIRTDNVRFQKVTNVSRSNGNYVEDGFAITITSIYNEKLIFDFLTKPKKSKFYDIKKNNVTIDNNSCAITYIDGNNIIHVPDNDISGEYGVCVNVLKDTEISITFCYIVLAHFTSSYFSMGYGDITSKE